MGDQTADRRIRLDHLLVRRGLARSRSSARQLIRDGEVVVAGHVEKRPGRRVGVDAQIELRGQAPEFVSRGGRKLAAALEHFELGVDGSIALDVGASTGGFTDCLLRAGARRVTAVDVGRDQLAPSLRGDARVCVLESTDARDLSPLDPPPDIVVVDVSFVRLRDVLPAVLAATPDARWVLVLLKPQFELPGHSVPRDGVVKDPSERNAVLLDFLAWAAQRGIGVAGSVASALAGSDGNLETFVLIETFA
ncbi:MAG: TlyA family RNA methyltransferase [Chloroflexi bacterium]|nr:TlyA family RNA methyltransferase [Chloroflexota bacterium]